MSTRVEQYRSAVLTTANQLTILRIVFVPVFIILLAYGEIGWALSPLSSILRTTPSTWSGVAFISITISMAGYRRVRRPLFP